jgi:hypothetical protein
VYELWNINCKSERNVWVVSQLIHYAQTYSLYFTTHTLRSGLQFVFHNSYITLRLTVYISQLIQLYALAWCMSCEIQTVSLSVMYELWNINCKPERNVWVVKYKLQFIFHNSYITLRLALCISQLKLYAQSYSLYFTTHTSRSGLQFIFHNSHITLRLTSLSVMYELWNINCKPERNVWGVKYKL